MSPRIALIHAVTVAIDPVHEAFTRLWQEANCSNLLEDSLSPDRERDGLLTPEMSARIGALADYAMSTGAHGILFTCSAFGEAIEAAAARLPIPVLKPNSAMFEAALERGERLGMLATFPPAAEGMEREFEQLTRSQGASNARLKTICVADALRALKAGDAETHNRLLSDAASQLTGCDAVMLAHFSTARAERDVSSKLDCPVLTSPAAAVRKLRREITGSAC